MTASTAEPPRPPRAPGGHGRYTGSALLRDLPARGRWYILSIITLGALVFCAFLPFAAFTPLLPLTLLILLSSLTSAFKVQFPIASGSNMSVSYVVDIAALILRGPHATMLVGAAGGWSQSTVNAKAPNPLYRTLFNMAILVLTVQAGGQVYWRLGGTVNPRPGTQIVVPLCAMAFTYFFVNTIPIAGHSRGFPKLIAAILILGLFIVAVLWLGFSVNYTATRDIYFAVAMGHVLAEAPFLLRMI